MRDSLAKLMDRVTDEREILIIKRRGKEDIALLPADELSSLVETAHLLHSPANARRLLEALERAMKGEGQPMTVEELRREVGLDASES